MNFKALLRSLLILLITLLANLTFSIGSFAYEIFIYRPLLQKNPFAESQKITVHGEYFVHLQNPSTFPSYNDLSGPEDRWNFGFQNKIYIHRNTCFLAQLYTHDDGDKRTKFDWHFSLRQHIHENLVFIIGHDSNHDSDRESFLNGKSYFTNRNYLGIGIPYEQNGIYIEPFTWFFHHSNQRGHLDLSGNELVQEYGIRIGIHPHKSFTLNGQIISQSEAYFSLGQALLADLILRIHVTSYLEISTGVSLWKDIRESRLGNKQSFYKILWGIVIPF